jgi:hypothetical protein
MRTRPRSAAGKFLLASILTVASLVATPRVAIADDTTAPTVLYVGPSNTGLVEIDIEIQDTNPDNVATEVHVFYNGTEDTDFTRHEQNNNLILLGFNHLPRPEGNYEVRVKPHDTIGNVGPEVVKIVQVGEQIAQLTAYGDFQGGAETAAGDVDGDGVDELITAASAGGGPHVRVFSVDYATHATTPVASWMAYDPKFTGGVRVSSADVDGDGTDEVITAPGAGGGPHVRVWHINGDSSVSEVFGFMAYDPVFTGGVYVSGGDIDGQDPHRDEIVVGPGAGGGPHIRMFGIVSGALQEHCGHGFMAYDPKFSGGVRVATVDVHGDAPHAYAVVTAAGPGGGPHVQAFENCSATAVDSFMAFDPNFRGGVYISGLRWSGNADALLVAAGPGGGPHIRLLKLTENDPFTKFTELAGFMAYDPNFHGGAFAAGGDFDGDLDPDIVTTPGAGMPVVSVARRWR